MNPTFRRVLVPRWRPLSALAAASIIGGSFEAAFLVAVTRAGLAIASGEESIELVGDISLSIVELVAVCTVLVLVRIASAVAAVWMSARVSSTVTMIIRSDLASAFLRATWTVQSDGKSGRLQELLTTFAQQGENLVRGVTLAVTNGFSLIALLAMAVVVDPLASLVVIVASVAIGLVLKPLRSAVRRQAKRTSGTGMSFATSLSEVSQLGMEMHVFGVQSQAEGRVKSLVRGHERTQRRLRFLQGLVPALYNGVAYLALVLALGAVASLEGSDLSSVGAVMLIMLRSLSYGQAMQTATTSINSTSPFLDELDRELDDYQAARLVDGTTSVDSLMPVALEQVSFEYETDAPVLTDFTLQIDHHEAIGVVGPSGSGKTTLVQLLLGLRSPTSGTITAGGVPIADIRRAQWNRKVTFVPQHAHLIAGTVADNIRFLRDDVSDDDIVRAAKLAHLHDDVVKWDGGYERQVGDLGGHLSGGQQQRLIIARALVEHPEILILDEPTSALDVRSEALIRETMQSLRKEMTIIIVAHRLSTLETCDRIMVIQDGELRGFDTPERLEATSDFYREALELSGLR